MKAKIEKMPPHKKKNHIPKTKIPFMSKPHDTEWIPWSGTNSMYYQPLWGPGNCAYQTSCNPDSSINITLFFSQTTSIIS